MNSKVDWEEVFKHASEGQLHKIDKGIYIRNYSSLNRIAIDHSVPKARVGGVAKLLIGPTGTGKSHLAFQEAGDSVYIKNPNTKWWDGYRGEEKVIIDEFCGRIDISYLLLWLDKYPCPAEKKCFNTCLNAKYFWITSNLTVEEWYPDARPVHIAALKRRIKVTKRMMQRYIGEVDEEVVDLTQS
jgi:hypothetical protein